MEELLLFDGMAMFNSTVLQDVGQAVIRAGLYSGHISKSSRKINFNNLTGSCHFDTIMSYGENREMKTIAFQKDSGYGDWFVLYREGTGELLLAKKNDDKSYVHIYYGTLNL